MNKKILKLGILTVAGAAIVAMKKSKKEKLVYSYPQTKVKKSDYKNTELNKQKKNSKGIYYSSGNYEAFARPKKPKDIEKKSAYLVGSGLASLAAACFLIRDAQMSGDHIHILEASNIAGGACQNQIFFLHIVFLILNQMPAHNSSVSRNTARNSVKRISFP